MKQLAAAGAPSVRMLNVDQLERAPGESLQPGDDAVDLLASGLEY